MSKEQKPSKSHNHNKEAVQEKEVVDEHIVLKVIGPDNYEVHFRVLPTTIMNKVMVSYAERLDRTVDSLRFLFDGCRVNPDDTPSSLQMDDGDIIEVYFAQVGGGDCNFY